MSASLKFDVDLKDFRAKMVGTRRVIEAGTARAVRIALDEGANYARSHHPHKRRTGELTSSDNLYGEMRRADSSGAWGYLINKTPYARCVEFGTKAHDIWPQAQHDLIGPVRAPNQKRRAWGKGPHMHVVGRGLALRFKVGGRTVFAKRVRHPGGRPYPFMHPAAQYARTVIERETENVTFVRAASIWGR